MESLLVLVWCAAGKENWLLVRRHSPPCLWLMGDKANSCRWFTHQDLLQKLGLYSCVVLIPWVYSRSNSLEFMNYKLMCSSLLKKKIIKPLHLIASPPCCVPTERKKREGPCVVSMARKVCVWGGGLQWHELNIPWLQNSLFPLCLHSACIYVLYSCLSQGFSRGGTNPH